MASIPAMWMVAVICSEPECWEEREIAVERLDELHGFGCECGAGFMVLTVSELAAVPA